MNVIPSHEVGRVGFVARELDRIAVALREPQPPERYGQLYAAQQALSWALDPCGFAAPLDVVASERVPTGTQAD